MSHIHLSVVWAEHGCLEIDITRFLIHSVDVGHIVVTLLHLTNQLTIQVVEIEVHITITIAWQQDGLLAHDALLYHFLLHILLDILTDEHLATASKRIDRIKTHIILMTVHRIDNEAVGIGRSLDARIVTIGIERYIELKGLATLHIIAPKAHLRIVLSCLRVLVGKLTRIFMIFRSPRLIALEHLKRVLFHLRLIEANPSDSRTIGIPGKSLVESKLLLIYPVGNTIDDFIELTIRSNLLFSLAIGNIKVVSLDKSHMLGVWRPSSHLLVLAFGKFGKLFATYIIYVELCLVGTAIHRLALGCHQELLAVRADDISIDRLERSLRLVNVKNHLYLLAIFERIGNNLLSVAADGSIQIGTFHRIDSRHITCSETTRSDGLQVESFCRFYC